MLSAARSRATNEVEACSCFASLSFVALILLRRGASAFGGDFVPQKKVDSAQDDPATASP